MGIPLKDALEGLDEKMRAAMLAEGAWKFECVHVKGMLKATLGGKGTLLTLRGKEGPYKIMLCEDCARRQKNGEELLTPEEVRAGKK
jgi:hypothetical protein